MSKTTALVIVSALGFSSPVLAQGGIGSGLVNPNATQADSVLGSPLVGGSSTFRPSSAGVTSTPNDPFRQDQTNPLTLGRTVTSSSVTPANVQSLPQDRGPQNFPTNNTQVDLYPRSTVRVDFEWPRPPPERVAARARTTLGNTLPGRFGSVSVQAFPDGRVILNGSVSNNHDRKLPAALVSLEPGVSTVENRVVVREPDLPQP